MRYGDTDTDDSLLSIEEQLCRIERAQEQHANGLVDRSAYRSALAVRDMIRRLRLDVARRVEVAA